LLYRLSYTPDIYELKKVSWKCQHKTFLSRWSLVSRRLLIESGKAGGCFNRSLDLAPVFAFGSAEASRTGKIGFVWVRFDQVSIFVFSL
jgi:hypothetical protein